MEAPGADPVGASGPLYREATNEWAAMTSTLYQHHTEVDPSAGSYRFDCVGFVSHAIRTATPTAWAAVVKTLDLPKGRIPSPPRYRAFFAGLAEQPQPGWEAVTNVAALRPGDVVAWEHLSAASSGHAVIVGGLPARRPDGTWLVEVYDATSSPHGDDSRLHDPRAEILESTGNPSGLGHGIMAFTADPANGALTGVCWGPKSKPLTVPTAAARPLR